MFDRTRRHVLRLFRVPHDPDPPAGAPGSLVVFRAGRNFYKLRLLRWSLGQLGALVGIVFSLQMLEVAESSVADARATAASRPALTQPSPPPTSPTTPRTKKRSGDKDRAMAVVARFAERSPPWLFTLLRVAKAIGIAIYLLQIPFTYAMARLDYELRWYMVTDRSLRIRAGLASVTETTMSFANIQQVVVTQGPLQRFLGLADVRVQSAGGGGGGEHHAQGMDSSLHNGIFHGVDNASQIRDVILERLRRFRAAGLGDPDDHATPSATSPAPVENSTALVAARELLAEARALRETLA